LINHSKRSWTELNREHKIDHLRFPFSLRMATMVAITILLCCFFCEQCNSLNDDCCGRICHKWTRSQIIRCECSQQTRSYSLRLLPAETSLATTELIPFVVGKPQSEVLQTYKSKW
jgi:hypothetical protein